MGGFLRSSMVAVLVPCLIGAPVGASAAQPLGAVTQAERARIGAGDAVNGVSVFSGETLTTERGGKLLVRLNRAQLYLLADSAAAMGQTSTGASAALSRGTVVFASNGVGAVEVQATQARIRPKTSQPTLAQITLVGPREFLVTSNRGTLEVAIGDEAREVPEMTSYRVSLEPDPVPGDPRQGPVATARSHFVLIATIIIAGVTAYAIYRALVSPDSP